jgi:group I intron endonuclease
MRNAKGKSGIYSAVLKHGCSNFSIEILEYCAPEMVIEREQFYIDSLKPVYNLLKFAGSSLGKTHSEETKKKYHFLCLLLQR